MRNRHTFRLLLKAAIAVGTIAGATASTAASAASAPAAVKRVAAVTAGWTHVPGSGYITSSSSCSVGLWTSQVSVGDPAYIAAEAFQLASPYPCTAMVQLSSDGGETWTSGTPVTLPASATFVTSFANTGAVYDGPGHLGRACAKASNSTLACTASISLGSGTGAPPNPALPASMDVRGTSAGNGSVTCDATLNSTTSAKRSGTHVDGEFSAGNAYSTASSLCEGWLETSANRGKTWRASARVTFEAPAKAVTYDFIGTYRDGPRVLARVCAEAPTVSATAQCSWAW